MYRHRFGDTLTRSVRRQAFRRYCNLYLADRCAYAEGDSRCSRMTRHPEIITTGVQPPCLTLSLAQRLIYGLATRSVTKLAICKHRVTRIYSASLGHLSTTGVFRQVGRYHPRRSNFPNAVSGQCNESLTINPETRETNFAEAELGSLSAEA